MKRPHGVDITYPIHLVNNGILVVFGDLRSARVVTGRGCGVGGFAFAFHLGGASLVRAGVRVDLRSERLERRRVGVHALLELRRVLEVICTGPVRAISNRQMRIGAGSSRIEHCKGSRTSRLTSGNELVQRALDVVGHFRSFRGVRDVEVLL